MKGEIVQEAKIFDPRNSPEYIAEVTRWRKSLGKEVSRSEESHHSEYNPLKFEEYRVSYNYDLVSEGPMPRNPQVPNLPTRMETVSPEEFQKN